jgi:hypothetical protein
MISCCKTKSAIKCSRKHDAQILARCPTEESDSPHLPILVNSNKGAGDYPIC